MKAHELAKKLLEGPNDPVVFWDGGPVEYAKYTEVSIVEPNKDHTCEYLNEKGETVSGNVVYVDP